MIWSVRLATLSLALPLSFALSANAASDAGSLMKQMENQFPKKQPQQNIPFLTDTPIESKTQDNSIKIFVKGFSLSGNSLISSQELQTYLARYVGKQLSFDDLQNTARLIADVYHKKGFQARAYLPAQDITSGMVQIVILEGKLSKIIIDSKSLNISNEAIQKSMEATNPLGAPLSMDRIDRGILLVNDLPGVKATGKLQAGEHAGETVLHLNVEDTQKYQGFTSLNNYGASSTGHNQVVAGMTINSPSGKGDSLSVQGLLAYGVKYGRVGYMIPVGYNGLRVGINASSMNYDVIHLDATGEAYTFGVNASYPLVRSRYTNVMLLTSYDRKKYENRVDHLQVSSKVAHVGTIGFDALAYDRFGSWSTASSVTLGYLDLTPDYQNFLLDNVTSRTNGHYTKIQASLTRNTDITPSLIFSVGLKGQLTNKNLDTSEKLYLGGPTGVRAYPLNEAGGDSGYIATASLRYNPFAHWSFTPFYDIGVIHQHRQLWTNWEGSSTAPNVYGISGKGIQVDYYKDLWTLSSSVAWKTGTNPNAQANGSDNDGSRDNKRVYIQLSRGF